MAKQKKQKKQQRQDVQTPEVRPFPVMLKKVLSELRLQYSREIEAAIMVAMADHGLRLNEWAVNVEAGLFIKRSAQPSPQETPSEQESS